MYARILKSFTSLPALYYSYRCSLEKNQLRLEFSSSITPLVLYWILESLATFTKLDVADLIMYVALKICLIEVLRWKIAQDEYISSRNEMIRNEVSTQCLVSLMENVTMDVTQSNSSNGNPTSHQGTQRQLDCTIYTSTSMDIATTSASRSPFSPSVTLMKSMHEAEKTSSLLTCTTQTSSSTFVNSLQTLGEKCCSGDWHEGLSLATSSAQRSLESVHEEKSVIMFGSSMQVPNGEDLITNPMFTLEFPRSGHKRCKKITMSNVSQKRILWTLRSNIVDSLSATPIAGILRVGEHDNVNVFIKDNYATNGKFAISYAFVDDTVQRFDRELYNILNRTERNLNVVFR
ncbi:MSP domain protein [Dictyocaulus viviparus]|uniref:Major sperm protein n=1 Tax=Dictyocaulus viviparus TaxID=29172 RepID=A0A0D8XVN5_DICVI|nr:MSP domain protein [Dictyocaulus viviparus]